MIWPRHVNWRISKITQMIFSNIPQKSMKPYAKTAVPCKPVQDTSNPPTVCTLSDNFSSRTRNRLNSSARTFKPMMYPVNQVDGPEDNKPWLCLNPTGITSINCTADSDPIPERVQPIYMLKQQWLKSISQSQALIKVTMVWGKMKRPLQDWIISDDDLYIILWTNDLESW